MKVATFLQVTSKLLVLWLLTVSSLGVWYLFYLAHIPPMVAAHPDFLPGRELPVIMPWVIDVAISWQVNHMFWTIAAVVVSASIIAERVSRGRWSPRLSSLLRAIPSIYGSALLLVSATFLYVVYATKA